MPTNEFQAIDTAAISTEALLNVGLDLPLGEDAAAAFSWEELVGNAANDPMITDQMALVIKQAVQSFASSLEFDGKMALAFGEGNDYSGLKVAWQAGEFDAFPTIELRPGTDLSGANAAYAGSTNTIYFSQDFLGRYANNSQAIASVLIEEFGHSVDWSVNAGIDTPGDEGELFSAIVQGINLSESQIQQMSQENDSVVLSLDISSLGQSQISLENSDSSYFWSFQNVFQQVISERPKTRVVVMNGILTPENGFNNGKQFAEALGLTSFDDSIEFQPIHNPTSEPGGPGTVGLSDSGLNLAPGLEDAFVGLAEFIADKFLQPAVDYWNRNVPYLSDEWFLNIRSKNIVQGIIDNPVFELHPYLGIAGLLDTQIQEIADFVDKYRGFENIYGRLNDGLSTVYSESNPLNDLIEALTQFWTENVSNASTSVNSQWVTGIPSNVTYADNSYFNATGYSSLSGFLSNEANSLMIVAHSQGNFFVEDALRFNPLANAGLSHLKVFALGSPTNYSSQGVTTEYVTLYKNSGDPIVNLQFQGGMSNKEKMKTFLTSLQEVMSISGKLGLKDNHDLGKYLARDDFQNDFVKNFERMNPSGYYFPNGLVYADTGFYSGTAHGDFVWDASTGGSLIQGFAGNDVLRGFQGKDTLIGGSGWDILDGGAGFQDIADYSDGSGIILYTETKAGSDIYRVVDGYAVQGLSSEDILVDIERIKGSDGNKDIMNGGDHEDFFLGQGGNDLLFGNKGEDYLDGGRGTDTLYGGWGNDVVYGGIGSYSDTIYGDDNDGLQGRDILSGGAGRDTIYGGGDRDIIYGDEQELGDYDGDEFKDETSISNGDIISNPVLIPIEASLTNFGRSLIGEASYSSFSTSNSDSSYSDFISGGDGGDNIYAGLGDDIVYGDEGNDVIFGETGNDYLSGGFGDDKLSGGLDADQIEGNSGNDIISSGDGNDISSGGDDDDHMYGDAGNDLIHGDDGLDTISGGFDNDSIYGDSGSDLIHGDSGNDTISGGLDDDEIYGDSGSDLVHGDSGNDTISGGDDGDLIYGDDGNDFIHGDASSDTISGGNDNDEIFGDAGDDLIHGDAGSDTISGGDNNDEIFGDAGNDLIYGDAGDDTIFGNDDNDTVSGGLGNDTLNGNDGNDLIAGDAGNDLIHGDVGNDVISGGDNEDQIYGDTGADLIFGDAGADLIFGNDDNDTVSGGLGNDTLNGNDGTDLIYGDAGNDLIHGDTDSDTISGGDDNDQIFGDAGADLIYGDAGVDLIFGNDDNDTVSGGLGNDTLNGNDGTDLIYGDAGNDLIHGDTGSDTISGGGDNDEIYGDTGSDLIFGDAGDDRIFGNDDNDTVSGGLGNDTINGNDGTDLIYGDAGNDLIRGDAGNDTISGGADNDEIYGDTGSDLIFGDDGADFISGGDDTDTISGGNGNDRINGDNADDLIYGDAGNDTISGGNGNDRIDGGTDNDLIYGDAGTDSIFGGEGADLIYGGTDDDLLFGDAGNDTLYGETGNDKIAGGDGADWMSGGDGTDFLNGQTGNDSLYGDAGNDTLYGEAGDDQLYGGDGSDSLIGGQGADLLDGGSGLDLISYYTSDSGVYIQLQPGHGNGGDAEGDRIYNIENVEGSYYNDTLIGDNGSNALSGLAGDDILDGKGDDDSLYGGLGNDSLEGREGNDLLMGGDSNDYLDSGSGDDLLSGGAGNDTIYGGRSGNDTLSGGDGDDYLNSSSGTDLLIGGAGNDTIESGSGDDRIDAGSGNDWVVAGAGDDWVFGGTGNDTLFGDSGNDTLIGGDGADILYAGSGDTLLIGGLGNDILYGSTGKGVDTFVLSADGGFDTVFNFQLGADILSFFGLPNLNDVVFKAGQGQEAQDTFIFSGAALAPFAVLKDVRLNRNQTPTLRSYNSPPNTIVFDPLSSFSEPPAPPALGGSAIFPAVPEPLPTPPSLAPLAASLSSPELAPLSQIPAFQFTISSSLNQPTPPPVTIPSSVVQAIATTLAASNQIPPIASDPTATQIIEIAPIAPQLPQLSSASLSKAALKFASPTTPAPATAGLTNPFSNLATSKAALKSILANRADSGSSSIPGAIPSQDLNPTSTRTLTAKGSNVSTPQPPQINGSSGRWFMKGVTQSAMADTNPTLAAQPDNSLAMQRKGWQFK